MCDGKEMAMTVLQRSSFVISIMVKSFWARLCHATCSSDSILYAKIATQPRAVPGGLARAQRRLSCNTTCAMFSRRVRATGQP